MNKKYGYRQMITMIYYRIKIKIIIHFTPFANSFMFVHDKLSKKTGYEHII